MSSHTSRLARCAGAAVAGAAVLTGCTSNPVVTSPSPTSSPTASNHLPTPTPPGHTAISLAGCPAAVDVQALHLVHHFTVSPDDAAVDSTGRIWITAREANLLFSLNADGSGIQTTAVGGGPEGVAIDGARILVAQQNVNAIAAIAPTRTTLITFPNHTANAGIDGIAIDAATQRLLVPDSPTGQLFAVPLSGPPTPVLLASHLGRPVAAAVDAAGNIFVASESTPGLVMITPAGSRRTIGHFTYLDEVVADAGLLYVTELDRRDVVAVDPATGASVPIAVHLPAPQGLAPTANGVLEIVDATTNSLYALPACRAGG